MRIFKSQLHTFPTLPISCLYGKSFTAQIEFNQSNDKRFQQQLLTKQYNKHMRVQSGSQSWDDPSGCSVALFSGLYHATPLIVLTHSQEPMLEDFVPLPIMKLKKTHYITHFSLFSNHCTHSSYLGTRVAGFYLATLSRMTALRRLQLTKLRLRITHCQLGCEFYCGHCFDHLWRFFPCQFLCRHLLFLVMNCLQCVRALPDFVVG